MGHAYPASPTFGVPCPTVMLTIGLLLTAPARLPWQIVVVPIVWSFLGGSAALLLGVATDYVLLVAGVVLVVDVYAQRVRPAAPGAGAAFALSPDRRHP